MSGENEKMLPQKRKRFLDILVIALAVIAVALLVLRLIGVRIYTVVSPSMENALSVGDLVVVAPENCSRIQSGDIITFTVNSSGHTETHRVFSKNEAEQSFVTKGDRNAQADEAPVPYSKVISVVRLMVPGIGYAAIFLATLQGKVLVGLLFMLFLVSVLLAAVCKKAKRSRRFR